MVQLLWGLTHHGALLPWTQPNVLMAGVVTVTVHLGRAHLPSTQRIRLNDSQVMEANS